MGLFFFLPDSLPIVGHRQTASFTTKREEEAAANTHIYIYTHTHTYIYIQICMCVRVWVAATVVSVVARFIGQQSSVFPQQYEIRLS